MMAIAEHALAKVNLCLHVVGRRDDGYHLLETMVVFADFGDTLTLERADNDAFTVSGPSSDEIGQGTENSVIEARDRLRRLLIEKGVDAPPVSITLEKNLPVAAGIGGGSADAAACLRGLQRLWTGKLDLRVLDGIALDIGADVPMCLRSVPLIASGIGEVILPLEDIPSFGLVLANPHIAISTPEVFRKLEMRRNPPIPSGLRLRSKTAFGESIATLRNDLETPATALAPQIADVRSAIAETGALVAGMSGSGATCFGLYDTTQAAREAETELRRRHGEWYIASGSTGPG
jgi:4-diphosphocytidyl-2-C-methyl-D-erythritol kinase